MPWRNLIQPAQTDPAGRLGDDDRERVGIDSALGLEHVRQPGPTVSPDRLLHRRDPVEVLPRRHLRQRHPFGKARRRGDRSHRRDHHRLHLFRLEPGGEQPLGKVGRPVVREVLPLEPRAALGEHAHLARDQVVQLGAVEAAEVAVVQEAAARPLRVPQKGAVPFERDTLRQPVGNDAAELRVEGREQLGWRGVGHDRALYDLVWPGSMQAASGRSTRPGASMRARRGR